MRAQKIGAASAGAAGVDGYDRAAPLTAAGRIETNNESLCIRDAKGQALAKRSVALFDTYALCRVTPLGMSAIKPHPKDPPLNDVSDISVARTTVRPSLQGHIEFEINSGTLISRLAMMDRYVPAAGDHQETGYCTHA